MCGGKCRRSGAILQKYIEKWWKSSRRKTTCSFSIKVSKEEDLSLSHSFVYHNNHYKHVSRSLKLYPLALLCKYRGGTIWTIHNIAFSTRSIIIACGEQQKSSTTETQKRKEVKLLRNALFSCSCLLYTVYCVYVFYVLL